MKKKLNVIDLDNTLLPYNSWAKFVMVFLSNWRCFFPIIFFSLLRGFGLLSRGMYQKSLLKIMRKARAYEATAKTFGEALYQDVRMPLVHFIQENTDEATVNVLCTASPEDYVEYLSKKLGWQYISSALDKDSIHFIHMFRERKIAAIQQEYPREEFDYHLAMSDDRGDLGLLKLFEKHFIVRKGRWQ
jgi:phosphoserine phosphatase